MANELGRGEIYALFYKELWILGQVFREDTGIKISSTDSIRVRQGCVIQCPGFLWREESSPHLSRVLYVTSALTCMSRQ